MLFPKNRRDEPRTDLGRLALMTDEAICTLIAHDKCPICIGPLTAYVCDECGFDSMEAVKSLDTLNKARDKRETETKKRGSDATGYVEEGSSAPLPAVQPHARPSE